MITKNNYSKKKTIIVRIDPDIKELIPAFLENRRKDIKKIRKSLDLEDYKLIQTLGHGMAGIGLNYGFETITIIGKSIEVAAGRKDYKLIQSKVDELLNFLDNVKVDY